MCGGQTLGGKDVEDLVKIFRIGILGIYDTGGRIQRV